MSGGSKGEELNVNGYTSIALQSIRNSGEVGRSISDVALSVGSTFCACLRQG